MTSCTTLSTALLSFAALFSLAARAEDHQPPPGSQPVAPSADRPETATARDLSWRQSDVSVALLNHGNMVWEHVHDARIGKPSMRFGLLDGTELTRPWPYSKDYPKNDHTWQRALWWSWKAIDGVNYWEGNQTGTEPVKVNVATGPDGAARIELAIAYRRPNEPPVTLAEPDAGNLDRALKRLAEGAEKARVSDFDPARIKTFSDYRAMYDRLHKEIDLVLIATPDHQHAVPSMMAIKLQNSLHTPSALGF